MIVRNFLLCSAGLLWVWSVYAQTQVQLQGVLPGRALLSINGGAPTSVPVGNSVQGVKVLSLNGDSAVVEIGGRKTTLRLGEGAVGGAAAAEDAASTGGRAVLQSDGRGHFVAQGSINGKAVTMMVDTGASVTVLPANEANRLGIDYRARGTPGAANTANGRVQTWNLSLDSVRIQGITLYNVSASVIEAPLNTILLGNSFL
ncbi:MAG: TIGR02281 family clan AA aspartic protease, partial [Burkholderiales bacterium]